MQEIRGVESGRVHGDEDLPGAGRGPRRHRDHPSVRDLAGLGRRPGPAGPGRPVLVRPGTRLVSICTGAFLLAAAGLLDGRRATTHWELTDIFRGPVPRVELDAGVLFVDHGDVLTSAGAASGVDICLHLVRQDHGSEVANQVARRSVVPPYRDGGQAQHIERPLPPASETGTGPTRDWALQRLQLPLSLQELAAHAAMSTRTFARRFRQETGLSPGRWLTQQRPEAGAAPAGVQRPAGGTGRPRGRLRHRHLAAAAPGSGDGGRPIGVPRRTFRVSDPAAGDVREASGPGAGRSFSRKSRPALL